MKVVIEIPCPEIDDLMHPISPNKEQRVANTDRLAARREEQWVID
jgi:hypothetical protein